MGLLIILKGNDFFTTAHKHIALHLLCWDNKLPNENAQQCPPTPHFKREGKMFLPHFLNSNTKEDDAGVIVSALIILPLVLLKIQHW